MSSAFSRGQIVTDALSLAGRGSELKQSCNQWLSYALRDLGLTFRFPELRKVGTAQTLSQGSQTVALPTDFGAGMAESGMIFGTDNKPLQEVSYEEFATGRGFPVAGTSGRPFRYLVDLNAQVFRFDRFADQNYSFTPVYFITPPLQPVDTSSDNLPVWLDNDMLAVHALIWWIYVFTNDEREQVQEARVEKMCLKWMRQTVKMGGTGRLLPSPARFRNSAFRGMGV